MFWYIAFTLLLGNVIAQTENITTFTYPDSSVTAEKVYKVNGSLVAPKGADVLTVGVIGGSLTLQHNQCIHLVTHTPRLWLGGLGTVSRPILSRSHA